MQTWAYAQASFVTDFLRSKLGVIEKDGKIIGVLCVQEIKLGPIHIVNLKRGPLWFEQPTAESFIEFAKAFRNEFPKTMLQRLRWMPEYQMPLDKENTTLEQIQKIGFKLRQENFITEWVDLSLSVDELRKKLDQKWRNGLNKAERLNLDVKLQLQLQSRDQKLFFDLYKRHTQNKKYKGPSEKFLKIEFSELEKTNDILYLWCWKENQPLACIVITVHGNTAAYRVGWNTEEGRKNNAHYLLIWNAIQLAKQKSLQHFDVGGLLPDESPGITEFKKGLRGRRTQFMVFG